MWLVATRKDDGAAVVIPVEDVAGFFQEKGASYMTILLRPDAPQQHQVATEIACYHHVGEALARMVAIAHPDKA